MKKLFISQPMNGRNEQEIKAERKHFEKHAFDFFGCDEVINSYFEDYNPENGCIPLKYLAKSIEMLADADVAVFCKGWENARGCRIEHECAVAYGIHVYEQDK